MFTIDRRDLLAAGALGAVTSAFGITAPRPARAQTLAAPRQNSGIYRLKLGNYEITALNDGVWHSKLDKGFVKNADWEDVQEALEEAFFPDDTLPIPFTQLHIDTGSKKVLIDTGTGGMAAPTAGFMLANMAAAGIDPKAVDQVLISHFHGDHINGLRLKDGALAFPNAEITVPAGEWAHWMDEAKMTAAPEAARGGFANAMRVFKGLEKDVKKVEGEKEVAPGITLVPTPGHTPGHSSFLVASETKTMMVLSDLTNHPALFVRNPDWHPAFDMDGNLAAATRRKVLDRVAADRTLVVGYHFPFPANGYIAKDGRHYEFVPAQWSLVP